MADPTRTNFATGTATTSSVTATFGFTATSGRLLVLTVSSEASISSAPSGWSQPSGSPQVNSIGHYLYYKVASGSETNAAFTISATAATAWVVCEYDSIRTTSPVDASSGANTGSGTTYTTPTLTPASGRRFVLASVGAVVSGTVGMAMGGWTNSYAEQAEADYVGAGFGGNNVSIGVALAALAMDGTGSATTDTTTSFTNDASNVVQARSAIITAFVVNAVTSGPKQLLLGVG